ncbi:MAG: hypothetical protein AB8U25_04010 [Rickettsiales endosymbiont of Dermacentor nuttalli]
MASHLEYGYSGAWSHFVEISNSIYIDINSINLPQIERIALSTNIT